MYLQHRLTSRVLGGLLWFVMMVTAAIPASINEQLEAIYHPLKVERAALSPDGNHAAFVTCDSDGLHVVVYRIDQPTLAVHRLLDTNADVHAQFLGWVGSDRLVVSTDASLVVAANPLTGESNVVADPATFAARKGPNPSVNLRVVGLSESPQGVVLEVSRFAPALVVQEAILLELKTGTRTVLNSARLGTAGGELSTDRQGRPRLQFDRSESPQRFKSLVGLRDPSQKPTWQPLDRLFKKPDPGMFGFNVTPENFLGERSLPLEFDFDSDLMYFASNVGRDTYGLYALNLETGRRTVVLEDPRFDLVDIHEPLVDSPLVFDRGQRRLAGVRLPGVTEATRWLDDGLAQIQADVDQKFPKRQVKMISWDDARSRFLLLASADRDPGRFFIYHRSDGRCVEYFRQTEMNPDEANPVEPFEFTTGNHGTVSGFLTRPHGSANGPRTLVIWLHDGPWQRTLPGFQADAQALASMGFVVAQINYRGSTGSGRRHSTAIQESYELVPVEDSVLTAEWLAGKFGIDPSSVAIGGEGFGGYVALRAVQLHPEIFSCAVALDAPFDLDWTRKLNPTEGENLRATKLRGLESFRPHLAFLGQETTGAYQGEFEFQFAKWCFKSAVHPSGSVDGQAGRLTRPVLLLHDPQNRANPIERVHRFAREVKPLAQLAELSPLFLRKVPVARVTVFRQIGDFLKTNADKPVAASARPAR